MPRVSILDSILNRPSQSYTPEVLDNRSQQRKGSNIRFAPPPDLPNAAGQPSSILSGNMFKRKPSQSYSGKASDAGRSNAGSVSGGSIFGRSRTSRDYGSQYAPSSIADSQATTRKGRWWEAGSMNFGKRSRAPSISGNSIYSQPAEDGLNPWPSTIGIASAAPRHRVSQSDYGGGSRGRQSMAPPMPKLDNRYYTSQNGRLQSNVAPLGNSTLNPTLTRRPSQQRVTSSSLAGMNSIHQLTSPPPSNYHQDGSMTLPSRVSSPPPRRALSPPPRPLSPTFSDSGRSMRSMRSMQDMPNGSQDWKDFVKGMSGTQVSKIWENDANVSNIGSALNNSKAVKNVERRKSNIVRVQKELEQDSQHEQVVRDPGIIHQDLLARAASQVVGSPPAGNYGDADLLGSSFRPGYLVSPPAVASERPRTVQELQQQHQYEQQQQSQQPQHPLQQKQQIQYQPASVDQSISNGAYNQQANNVPTEVSSGYERAAPTSRSTPASKGTPSPKITLLPQPTPEQEALSSEDSESEGDDEEESSEDSSVSEEKERKRQHLAVVNEEEEETSSGGHEMVPQQAADSMGANTADRNAAKFSAFDAHLKRSSQSGHDSPTNVAVPLLSVASPYPDVYGRNKSPAGSIRTPTRGSTPTESVEDPVKPLPQIITSTEDSLDSSEVSEDVSQDITGAGSNNNKTDTLQAAISSKDDADTRSIRSNNTGRATVKFEGHSKDDGASINSDGTISRPKSLTPSTRSNSRPPTLSRRLSDISMGTSFGMSGILRGASRASLRRRASDNDADSVRSLSDEEGGDELKANIRAEQDRLRNMKVGEDFFGGSLSSILDKFGVSSFDNDEEPKNLVGHLDLDVGSSGKAKGGTLSTQEILTMNAQERINEVRRQRTDPSRSIRTKRDSDAITIQSGIAPSFAAIWLLNQDGPSTPPAVQSSPPASTRAAPPPPQATQAHMRSVSNEGNNSSPTTTNRLRNFFNSKPASAPSTASAESPERKTSVMDRPRNRGKKPRQMAGVPISQGKLAAEVVKLEDTRSTLPALAQSKPLSQMQDKPSLSVNTASTSTAPRSSMTSSTSAGSLHTTSSPVGASGVPPAPSVPVMPVSDQPPSKDKPAPVKSALKPRKSKSLADTLFSFASTSPKKKARNADVKEAKRAQKDEIKSLKSDASLDSIVNNSDVKSSNTTPPRRVVRTQSSSSSIYVTPEKEKDAYDLPSEKQMSTFYSAQDLSSRKDKDAETYVHPLQRKGQSSARQGSKVESDAEEEVWEPALPDQPATNDGLEKVEEDPPMSETSAGDSVASTGPTTPGASDALDRYASPTLVASSLPTLMSRRSDSPKTSSSPSDKKLPMPPVPQFPNGTPTEGGDITPVAVAKLDPIHTDYNQTSSAAQPSFGLNLIPPTPPALESRQSYTSMTSSKLMGAKPDTVAEQPEEEDVSRGANVARSTSSASNSTRKGTAKRGILAEYQQYQGRGLNLPPGLIVTTVASSASRRQNESSPHVPVDAAEVSRGGTIKQKKTSKGKRSSQSPSRTYLDPNAPEPSERSSSEYSDSSSPRRSSSALKSSLADAPPVPSLPASTSVLTIPSSRSETNSSNGSDSVPRSHTNSPSPSPAPSVSSRSRMSSSNASVGAASASDFSNPRVPRKIRTLSAAPNGQARTSLMSAISEWDSPSPVDQGRMGARSPMNAFMDASRSDNGHSRGPSSVHMASSASSATGHGMNGGPNGNLLHPRLNGVRSSSGHAESLDGHGARRPWRGSYAPSESDMSNLGREETSLTKPYIPSAPQSLAGYKHNDPTKASNTIDDRLYAKTTMSTISVTSGAFPRSKSLRKRRSTAEVSNLGQSESARSSRLSIDTMPEELVEELQRTTMSMTAHTPPPRKLTSTQVLVQIMTCAIDETDRQLLREEIKSMKAYGFIPGRSFCGRVMETGWEVKRVRKGDVVFGLQSSRKCGALAEFMTIDQNLIAKAPEDCLTTEEIAALPAVGVMAYQMMTNHCSQLKRGSRILILNAHDGVGLLTMQEAANLGLIIVAQCPDSISDGVALCEANGANEVVIGEPLWALNSLHESSFDLVLDTVGGRRVYDAARRILAFEGQFCTCVGDMNSSVNPNLKSHFRSLRRSFFKKDTKRIGYEWLAIDVGEDCREALESVKLAAERGLICPRLQSILSFADAPRAFEVTLRGGRTEPGSVVVKVS